MMRLLRPNAVSVTLPRTLDTATDWCAIVAPSAGDLIAIPLKSPRYTGLVAVLSDAAAPPQLRVLKRLQESLT